MQWSIETSAAIELLTRMHCVKNTMFEDCKGRHSLTGDVIIGAFGLVQHKHPMGMRFLMARYLDNASAKRQAQLGIEKWLKLIEHNGSYEMAACYLALEVFLEKPIGNQPRV